MKTRRLAGIAVACLMLAAMLVTGLMQPATAQAEDSVWVGEHYSNPWLGQLNLD